MSLPEKCWWSFRQLTDWYRGKMLFASNIEAWATRNQEFEGYTGAFHVGLKLLDHWEVWRVTTYVHAIEEEIKSGKKPLQALVSQTGKKTREFVSFEVSKSFTASDLDEKTKERIKSYSAEKSPASLNTPMSDRGKKVLKEVYRFLTKDLKKGDPRLALQDALTGDKDVFGGSQSLYISKDELLD